MKWFILFCALAASSASYAQALDKVVSVQVSVADAGMATVSGILQDGGTLIEVDVGDAGVVLMPSLDSPITSARGFYLAVRTGDGWLAGVFILFFFVGTLRIVGKWAHGSIPDDTKNWFLKPVERVLFFFFDTKVGGWLLNWLSAIGGCLTTAMAAGMAVDATAWQVAVMSSTGATALIELKDDLVEWWQRKKAEAEVERAAKAAVVAGVIPATPAAITDPAATPEVSGKPLTDTDPTPPVK
jgi:hypothetical protein